MCLWRQQNSGRGNRRQKGERCERAGKRNLQTHAYIKYTHTHTQATRQTDKMADNVRSWVVRNREKAMNERHREWVGVGAVVWGLSMRLMNTWSAIVKQRIVPGQSPFMSVINVGKQTRPLAQYSYRENTALRRVELVPDVTDLSCECTTWSKCQRPRATQIEILLLTKCTPSGGSRDE